VFKVLKEPREFKEMLDNRVLKEPREPKAFRE
jgi:hypothetical protein